MPTYVYRCPECRLTLQDIRPYAEADDFPLCPECHDHAPAGEGIQLMKRIPATFAKPREFVEGINPSTGKLTTSANQHADNLKRMAEAQTIRTGIEHNYVPVSPGEEREQLGITDEGLESTHRAARARGESESRLWL